MTKKNGNLVIVICTIIFVSLGLFIVSTAFEMGYNGITFNAKPADSSSSGLKQLAADGTLSLSSDDITSLFPLYLSKIKDNGPLKIDNIKSSINDNTIGFYATLKFYGLKLPLSTKGKLESDNTLIAYYPEHFKLGILTLPKKLAYRQIESYMPINTEKDRIEIEKSKLPLEIEDLELKDDMLKIKFAKFNLKNTDYTASNENLENIAPNSDNPISNFVSPFDIANDILQNSTSTMPSSKSGGSSAKQNVQVPSAKGPINSSIETSSARNLLSSASTDLKKVYSEAETTNEKQLIQLVQNIVSKMSQNEYYSYENDAALVMLKYNKLSIAEKNNLEKLILNNMDIDALLKLGETLGVFSGF